jgi:hypothetical protein
MLDLLKAVVNVGFNSTGAEKVKADLGAVENKIDSVKRSASGLGAGFSAGLGGMSGPIGDVASKFEGLRGTASTMAAGVSTAGAAIGLIGGVAITAAAGLVAIATRAAEAADKFGDLSDKTGMSTDRLSLMDQAAKLGGTTLDELISSSERLAMRLSESGKAGEENEAALKRLGVSVKDAAGNQRDWLQVQEEIVLAAKNSSDSAQAEADATTLLGREYVKLGGYIEQTSARKREMYDLMSRTGAIVTKDLAEQSGKYNDNIQKLGVAFTGMANSIASAVMPALNNVINKIVDISTRAAELIAKYSGTETPRMTAVRERNESQREISQLEESIRVKEEKGLDRLQVVGARGVGSVNSSTSLAQDKARLAELRDLIKRQQGRVDTYDEEVRRALAGTDTKPPSGGTPTPTPPSAPKAVDPTSTPEYREAMRAAQERSRLRNQEYDQVDKYLSDQYIKEVDAAHKQTEAYQKQAESIRDLLSPMRELQRQIDEVNANPILSDAEKEDAVARLSEKWVKAHEDMKRSTEELSDTARLVFGTVENVIVNAVTTGEISFKGLAKSFIEQLFRMFVQAQIIGPMIKALTGTTFGSFLGLGPATPSADGNVFSNGIGSTPMAVQNSAGGVNTFFEQGPEAVVPLVRGANGQLGVASSGGSGVTVGSIQIVVQGGKTNEETGGAVQKALLDTMKQIADGRISEATRPGGLLRR